MASGRMDKRATAVLNRLVATDLREWEMDSPVRSQYPKCHLCKFTLRPKAGHEYVLESHREQYKRNRRKLALPDDWRAVAAVLRYNDASLFAWGLPRLTIHAALNLRWKYRYMEKPDLDVSDIAELIPEVDLLMYLQLRLHDYFDPPKGERHRSFFPTPVGDPYPPEVDKAICDELDKALDGLEPDEEDA